MSKYNFQAWLQQKISDEPEVVLAGKLEYLRLYLTYQCQLHKKLKMRE
ncbi:hypothetical protein [Scytonema hofmannii]|nr:hypothetical protein [Scytonema hofmannii]